MPTLMIATTLALHLNAPALGRHARIDETCRSLLGEEALRCRNETDAQCDISDAEEFIATGDAGDAVSRVDQACAKYEDLLNMMMADLETDALTNTMIRYASAVASIFALLAREGTVEDLDQAVTRLARGRSSLLALLERRSELADRADLVAALDDLTKRLAAALDQLARQEMLRADIRYKAANGDNDGGARSYYATAAKHSAAAYRLVPVFAYKVVELDAALAQAELDSVRARNHRDAGAPACAGYRQLRHELNDIARSAPMTWKNYPQLRDFQTRAERGVRACSARPRLAAGGVLLGVGAVGVGVALGLYTQYNSACAYSSVEGACIGIPSDSPDTDRFTTQVRASIGLAAIGGALFTTGASVLVHGLVQKALAKPRRFAAGPRLSLHHAGARFTLRF